MLKTLSIFLGLMIVSASAQAAPACEQNRTVTCLAHDGRVVSNSYCDKHTDKIGQATTRLQQTCRLPEEVVQTKTRETVKRCTKPWQIGNYTIRERQVTTETVTCDVTVGDWENPPKTNSSNGYSTFSGWGSSSSGTSAAPHAASSSSNGNSFFGGLVRKASSLAQDYIRTASTPETVITPCKCKAGYVKETQEKTEVSGCGPSLDGQITETFERTATYNSDCQTLWTEWERTDRVRRCRSDDDNQNPFAPHPSHNTGGADYSFDGSDNVYETEDEARDSVEGRVNNALEGAGIGSIDLKEVSDGACNRGNCR